MSVPPNLNPDNISLREMSTAERFMIMFGQPIPRCEWTTKTRSGLVSVSQVACVGSVHPMSFFESSFIFCPNCGSRIKFITK